VGDFRPNITKYLNLLYKSQIVDTKSLRNGSLFFGLFPHYGHYDGPFLGVPHMPLPTKPSVQDLVNGKSVRFFSEETGVSVENDHHQMEINTY